MIYVVVSLISITRRRHQETCKRYDTIPTQLIYIKKNRKREDNHGSQSFWLLPPLSFCISIQCILYRFVLGKHNHHKQENPSLCHDIVKSWKRPKDKSREKFRVPSSCQCSRKTPQGLAGQQVDQPEESWMCRFRPLPQIAEQRRCWQHPRNLHLHEL